MLYPLSYGRLLMCSGDGSRGAGWASNPLRLDLQPICNDLQGSCKDPAGPGSIRDLIHNQVQYLDNKPPGEAATVAESRSPIWGFGHQTVLGGRTQ
jgi:hypothetical protein